MHTVNLIANHIYQADALILPCEPKTRTCCVTGEEVPCVPKKYLFSSNFTNFDILRAPQSEWVGTDAYVALKYKWERCSSWYVDEKNGFQRLDRQGVRNKVINGNYGSPMNHWSAYATTSYKKHGALFTKVNVGDKAVWRFEQLDVDCSGHEQLFMIWERLNQELRDGYPRPVLETLNCSTYLLKKYGPQRWIDYERWAKPMFMSGLYQFLCYLLPSQEELKNEKPAI